MGQTVSISTSSSTVELTKLDSNNMSNLILIGQSSFTVPSFCLMTNQMINCQNKTLIIQVNIFL
jgi:hypothetical protein